MVVAQRGDGFHIAGALDGPFVVLFQEDRAVEPLGRIGRVQLGAMGGRKGHVGEHVGLHLVHHSDRSVQYASAEYAARLDTRGFQRSMSRPGNPYDNAKAESLMKRLKTEEAHGQAYANHEDARRRIGGFIEDVYNADRLHSALGYKLPIAFEAALRKTANRDLQPLTALSPN